MEDGYLGQVILFAGNFAPQNWALCNGQLMPVNQYQALFSVLGTTYGGDGINNFKLPDLRGAVPVSAGVAATGTSYLQGTTGGTESTTLGINQMPSHNHVIGGTASVSGNITATMKVNSSSGGADSPSGNFLGNDGTTQVYASANSGSDMLNANAITVNASGMTVNTSSLQVQPNGLGQPFSNMQPYLVMNYIICTNGLYPSKP